MRSPKNHQEEDRQLLSQTRLPEKVSHHTQVMRLAAEMMRAAGHEPPLSLPPLPRTEPNTLDQTQDGEPQVRPPLHATPQLALKSDGTKTRPSTFMSSASSSQH